MEIGTHPHELLTQLHVVIKGDEADNVGIGFLTLVELLLDDLLVPVDDELLREVGLPLFRQQELLIRLVLVLYALEEEECIGDAQLCAIGEPKHNNNKITSSIHSGTSDLALGSGYVWLHPSHSPLTSSSDSLSSMNNHLLDMSPYVSQYILREAYMSSY
jgi:hypothetical protein